MVVSIMGGTKIIVSNMNVSILNLSNKRVLFIVFSIMDVSIMDVSIEDVSLMNFSICVSQI